MAKNRASFLKMQRERARQDKARKKKARRSVRTQQKPERESAMGSDPDIAHIVPGPQPVPWEMEGLALGTD